MTINKFNLIDEPWIPIVTIGKVSLRQVFTNPEYPALSGNAVQKIALTKLILAIAQAAYTPSDLDDWKNLGVKGMSKKCLDYLDKWYDRFWLYGDNPFLQMPTLLDLIYQRKNKKLNKNAKKSSISLIENEAKPKSMGSGIYPDLPSENNSVFTESQFPTPLTDSEKAVFIISLMNFALGGKRIEKGLEPLSKDYLGKSDSAKSGPSLGNYTGYTHSFFLGRSLLDTIWLNLLTTIDIKANQFWQQGLGTPPWEFMPTGEACEVAKQLKNSYMGCLLAMCRFVLLQEEGIYYMEGIQYPSHTKGWREPSIALNNENKALWIDPEKRPWRELTSLLSFLSANSNHPNSYDCPQLRYGIDRIKKSANPMFYIWSGGLKVRGNAGDQSIKQTDDFVESTVMLSSSALGEQWYHNLMTEMNELDNLSRLLYKKISEYFKSQNMNSKTQPKMATHLFWQLCEHQFQTLVNLCAENDNSQLKSIRKVFSSFILEAYNSVCPKETARQLDAWAKNKPNLIRYSHSR